MLSGHDAISKLVAPSGYTDFTKISSRRNRLVPTLKTIRSKTTNPTISNTSIVVPTTLLAPLLMTITLSQSLSASSSRCVQRRLSGKRKGSKRWRQLSFSLARLHRHVKRQRDDYQNKLLSNPFKGSDVLVLEKLNVQGMLRNHSLAKSMADSSFGKFISKALFKADVLGKYFVAVDPWGTTQFCYNCLEWVPKNLSERRHKCPSCGELPRDLNSAKLIRRLGILCVRSPTSDGGSSPAELRPLPSLRGMVSRGFEAGSPSIH